MARSNLCLGSLSALAQGSVYRSITVLFCVEIRVEPPGGSRLNEAPAPVANKAPENRQVSSMKQLRHGPPLRRWLVALRARPGSQATPGLSDRVASANSASVSFSVNEFNRS